MLQFMQFYHVHTATMEVASAKLAVADKDKTLNCKNQEASRAG